MRVHSVVSDSLQPHVPQGPAYCPVLSVPLPSECVLSRLSRVRLCAIPWIVARHALLQGIFPTQGLNPDFLHCRQILYCLSHQGSLLHPSSVQNASFHLSPESMIARHLTPSTSTFFSTNPPGPVMAPS